jgi:hypothetical protein
LVTSPCLTVERLLSTPRTAAQPIVATRLNAKPERLVKPKIETKHEERPRERLDRSVEPKAAAPKAVDRVVFQLVDGLAVMKLRLTYVMKGGEEDSHCKRRGAVFCVGGGV